MNHMNGITVFNRQGGDRPQYINDFITNTVTFPILYIVNLKQVTSNLILYL